MRECPKCHETSGNDWTQCGMYCPMIESPKYNADEAASYEGTGNEGSED